MYVTLVLTILPEVSPDPVWQTVIGVALPRHAHVSRRTSKKHNPLLIDLSIYVVTLSKYLLMRRNLLHFLFTVYPEYFTVLAIHGLSAE